MKYSAEEFSLAGDKYIGRPYSEMDCQAFVERCMKDIGLRMNLPGSNAWYRKMTWTGSPEECVKVFGCVPKGALLYILKQDGGEPAKYQGDGIGNAQHIGIKTGRNDGAIHSSSSRGCVCTSKFKDKTISGGWNRVGLWDQFDYGKTVDWHLQHGNQSENNGGEKPMQGKTTAKSGSTVNLRKTKNGALLDRIPVGTELEILEYGPEWSKVVVSGLVGWMMSEFIEVTGADPEPVADDSGIPAEDFGEIDLDPAGDDAAQLLAEVYASLRGICEKIEKAIGRG